MTKKQAIHFYGSQTKLARALGLSQSTISEWEEIPEGRQYQIEIATRGKLRADKPALRKVAA